MCEFRFGGERYRFPYTRLTDHHHYFSPQPLLGDALVAHLTRGDSTGLAGYSEASLRRVWDYQEFSQWLSDIYHGASSGDPHLAGTTLARLRRLFTQPAAALAFAEQYLGSAAAF